MKVSIYTLLAASALSGIVGCSIGNSRPSDVYYDGAVPPKPAVEKVLDGDTIIVDGQVIKIRGLDAPEVGTNASCLAEAALGGLALQHLAGQLQSYRDYSWELKNVDKNAGRVEGDLLSSEGENIVEEMTINGYAIASNARWDWCEVMPDFDDNQLYPAINVGSGPPSDVEIAND